MVAAEARALPGKEGVGWGVEEEEEWAADGRQ